MWLRAVPVTYDGAEGVTADWVLLLAVPVVNVGFKAGRGLCLPLLDRYFWIELDIVFVLSLGSQQNDNASYTLEGHKYCCYDDLRPLVKCGVVRIIITMSFALHELVTKVQGILTSPASTEEAKASARQLLFHTAPLSDVVESYLYDNEGRPQNLSKFQMMRAIYDKIPQRLLLKCSRKTLKSTLLSNMIALNLLRFNHYKMLYVAPQELSTKYFSNNYLNVRFESPPLKRMIRGWGRNDVFEKILQDTNSSVILRYCNEDATRLRGPAVDENTFDECVTGNTLVLGRVPKRILDIRPGDTITSFDASQNIRTDKVKKVTSKGRRPTWRITLSDSSFLECTSNERLLTNRGWYYLAQLLPIREIKRCPKALALYTSYSATETAPFRDVIGRWGDGVECKTSTVQSEPWVEATRVRAAQSEGAQQLSQHPPAVSGKQRVWNHKLCFCNGDFSSVRILTHSMLRAAKREIGKEGWAGMVKPAYMGRNGLLVHGRRLATSSRECAYTTHRRVSEKAGQFNTGVATDTWASFQYLQDKRVLHGRPFGRRNPGILRKDQALRHTMHALQVEVTPSEAMQNMRWSDGFCRKDTLQETRLSYKSEKNSAQEVCRKEGAAITRITYIGEQEVFDLETEVYHTFFANGIAVHNCQDISFDVLPIIKETMALSPFKREVFAGTPLTTDNTINELWKTSSQCEWATKCAACNHWNTLTLDNEPLKMVQKEGLSCSKCQTLLDTGTGEWVEFNPAKHDLIGYHLAQPILTHFNQDPKEWADIYKKVWNTGPNRYSMAQIYNEVFGLAFDTGSKPITEETLKKLTVMGDMTTAFERNKHRYMHTTCGVDWGVNMQTSRTAIVMGGLRDDGVYEVFFARILKDFDYEKHIVEIADRVNAVGSFCACDAGPDVARGKKLMDLTSYERTQLVRYEDGLLIQHYKVPPNAAHPSQNRWCLHRSDTMTFTFDLLKKGMILFPMWEQTEECLTDILNVFIEVKEGALRQELVYRHPAAKPDDFFHALNFAVVQAHLLGHNQLLQLPSSTALTAEWHGGTHG